MKWFILAVLALLAPANLVAGEDKKAGDDKKPVLEAKGELGKDDPMDDVLKKSFAKVHTVKLEEGKTYRFELNSKAFDSYLRLEDADKKRLAQDDDGGGFPHARLVFTTPKGKGGEYRVIVTTYTAGETGEYLLRVAEGTKLDMLEAKVRQLPSLPPDEQGVVLAEFRKHIAERGKDISAKEVQLGTNVAMQLEMKGDPKVASDVYRDFGKAFGLSTDPKVTRMARMMEGASRRMDLVGNPIEVKGTLLDGKPIDWSKYKDKVVLVDFWATWCGPCLAELPSIKKMYETYHKRGFDVVGISLDRKADIAKDFMEKQKLPWVSIFEEPGEGKERMTDHYGVFLIPQAILVDRNGRVVSLRARGAELPRLLEKLIGPPEENKESKK